MAVSKIRKRWIVAICVVPVLIALSYGMHYFILRNTVPVLGGEHGYEIIRTEWFTRARNCFYHQQTPILAALIVLTACSTIALWGQAQPATEKLQYWLVIFTGIFVLATPALLFLALFILILMSGTMFVNAVLILYMRPRNWKYAIIPLSVGLICTAWNYWYIVEWCKVFWD